MLNDIVRPDRRLEVTYELCFFVEPGGGFEFPCDADGNLLPMNDAASKNYKYCMEHPEKFSYCYNVVHKYSRWIKDAPYGTCHCGETVYLLDEYMGACQCPKCGQWYNLFGQELLPPDEWEDVDYGY